MDNFSFWQKWIFIVGLMTIAFGLFMAVFSGNLGLFNNQINSVFWSDGNIPAGVKAFQGWIYGVLGATMAGWGVFSTFIAHYPFRQKEKWSWNCVATGLLLWYVVDTIISVSYGVYFNAVFNTVLMVFFILPLIFTRKHFVS